MNETTPAPVRVGVISAGPTHLADKLIRHAELPILLREDLRATTQPDDVGLVWFLALMNALARSAAMPRPFAYAVVGNAQDRSRVREAWTRLLAHDVDIIAWWTFSPLLLDGPPEGAAAFEDLLQQAQERGVALAFPAAAGSGAGRPGVFSANGVVATRPYLDVCATPEGWTANVSAVTAWGDWETMKVSWQEAGVPTALPDSFPQAHGHSLAVWSVAAALASINASSPARLTLDQMTAAMRLACVPVEVRPPGLAPALGFFEPRQLEVRADRVRMDAA